MHSLDVSAAVSIAVFAAVYTGMALGRWPGVRMDRAGIALVGAVLLLTLAENRGELLATINGEALALLFGLMLLSAQFEASGLYRVAAGRLAAARRGDLALVAGVAGVTGTLSALLANDVIVFAMTPILCIGLRAGGRDPVPFLLAHAGAANAGSAATLIGNPQNILIGEAGDLDFWRYLIEAMPVAVIATGCTVLLVHLLWRGRYHLPPAPHRNEMKATPAEEEPGNGRIDRGPLTKAVVLTVLLLGLFASPIPRWLAGLAIAALVLVSRRNTTRALIGRVDWGVLLLLGALFIVTQAVAPLFRDLVAPFAAKDRIDLATLAGASLLGGNTIGNVPFVVLFLSWFPALGPETLTRLAVFSTLAGNFLLIGSLANIIVAERAAHQGVRLRFRDFAAVGIPSTLLAMGIAYLYFTATGTAG
ncbi:anion transporter [Marivibrio halodurans]|uniref:Anion transporter n=1 Tax=Marivibrio halodurans TaxID=2039722 RepID=A0A8J7S354_9PROT|nr:SLC13 family permease [Marivibrio halodurans]MBP5857834.1 anion transporter [Marivibrio halodurans]